MDGALATLAGLAWLAVLDLPLLAAAGRVAGRLRGLAPLDRLSATLGLWFAGTLAAGVGAGALGHFHRPGLLATSALLSCAAWVAVRGRPGTPWWRDLATAAARTAARHPLAVAPPLAALAAAVLAVAWAAPRPPVGFDALNYHLPVAWHLAQTGSLAPLSIPPWFGHFSWFPAGAETWTAWHLVALGSDLPVPFAQLPFLALLATAATALARDAGAGRAGALAFASVVLTLPMTFRALPEPYVEVPYWACLAASLQMARAWARGAGTGALAAAGALAGLLASIKATGPLHGVLVLGVAAASAGGWTLRRALAGVAAFGGALAALGAPFYLRSWWATGNPVYPVPVRLAGAEVFPGLEGYGEILSRTALWPHLGPLWRLGRVQEALVGTLEPPNDSWGLGPGGAAMAAAGLVATAALAAGVLRRPRDPSRRRDLAVAVAGLAAAALYLVLPRCGQFLHGNARFAWPAAFLLGLALAGALARWPAGRRATAPLLGLLAAANLAWVRLPLSAGSVITAALAVGAGAAAAWALSRRTRGPLPSRRAGAATALLALVAVAAGAVVLDGRRSGDRAAAYGALEGDSGPLPWARRNAPCLALVERALPQGTLAVAPARGAQHAWFLGALPGHRGQRRLAFVPSGTGPTPLVGPTPDRDPGLPGDAAAWAARLREGPAGALLVLADEEDVAASLDPPERAWARADPARFPPAGSAAGCEVFSIARDAP